MPMNFQYKVLALSLQLIQPVRKHFPYHACLDCRKPYYACLDCPKSRIMLVRIAPYPRDIFIRHAVVYFKNSS